MSSAAITLIIFTPIVIFGVWSYLESRNVTGPVTFLQFGEGYKSPDFVSTLLASNSSLSGALLLVAFYGSQYGMSIFVWVFLFWVTTQIMSYYTVSWVTSLFPDFISNRGTLHEFLGRLFGSTEVRIAAARVSMFSYVGLLASEAVIGYGIVSAVVPGNTQLVGNLALEPAAVTIGATGLVAIYATMAGFRGVVRTDELQLLLIGLMMVSLARYHESAWLQGAIWSVFALGVLAWWVRRGPTKGTRRPKAQADGPTHAQELSTRSIFVDLPRQWTVLLGFLLGVALWVFVTLETQGSLPTLSEIVNPLGTDTVSFVLFFVVANVLFWVVWWPSAMDQWHRCGATADESVSQDPILGTVGLVPILYLAILTVSFLLVGVDVFGHVGDPLAEFLSNLSAQVGSNPAVFVLVTIGLVAAMISTLDSYLVVASQTWVVDQRVARVSGMTLSELSRSDDARASLPELRTAVGLVFVGAALIALFLLTWVTDITAIIYFAFSGMLVIAGVLVAGFFRRSDRELLGPGVVRALRLGMVYVVLANVVVLAGLEASLRGLIPVAAPAVVQDPNSWYYAVFTSPVIAMLLTAALVFVSAPAARVGSVAND